MILPSTRATIAVLSSLAIPMRAAIRTMTAAAHRVHLTVRIVDRVTPADATSRPQTIAAENGILKVRGWAEGNER